MPTAPQNTDELYQALEENDRRPYGRTRTVTAEELVDAAEQFAEPVPLVHALFELQEAYTYGSEPRKSPVVFARLLNLFDEQPDVFDERRRHTLFWRFKWVADALRVLPEIPLAGLRQWQTEMRDRYEKAGLGLQPYYGQAYQLAAHIGEGTTLAYELWAGRSRTGLSDCEACEICERALYHLAAGDDERALNAWEPVLAGKESCQEEPARSVSHALLPLLRGGRVDRARELHLAGYRNCRRNPSMSSEVGRHLEFCALTGNEARGLELLAENRNLFGEVDSPLDLFDFLTGVEVLLQRVESLGHGELPAAGYAGRTWTVAGLRAEVRGRADDLAARFDTRNGTTAHTDRRRARLDRAPLVDALELTLRTRGLDEVAPAAPVVAPAARTAAEVPESLPELILRARTLDEQGHPDARACWARLRTLAASRDYAHPDDPAVGPLAQLRADLLSDEASRTGEKDEFAEAAALHEEAAGLYEDAGAQGDAAVARACALLAVAEIPAVGAAGAAGAGGADGADGADGVDGAGGAEVKVAALAAAHAAMVRLHEEASGLAPHQEARLLRLRATALGMRLQTSGDEAHVAPVLAEADLLLAFATRHDLGGQISGALLLRATTHALAGDLPAAVTVIDGVLDRLKAHGPAWHLPRTLALRGRLQLGLRDAQAAQADLAEGLRLAADWPADVVDTARLHADLAEVCMHLGRPDEALRHLTRSAELELRRGTRTDAYCAYSNAAQLCLDLGRIEDCIALLDSLLAEPDVAAGEVDDRLVAQLRLIRARALHTGEDLKAATTEFVVLAAESAGWDDDPGSHAMIAAETAVLLGESGEFGRAREAAEQAIAAHAGAPRYEQLSGCLRELARLQAERQGPEGLADALANLADAGRIADEARAAEYEAQGRSLDTALAYEHGRVNAYAGEYEDALAALEKALALLGEPTPERGEDHAGEWAECVRLTAAVEGIYLERPAPALNRLDAAVSRLTALGHTEEAEPLSSLANRLRDGE
ncbi:tetratricopeptide repeat protein [Streptomyces sp. NBC_00893]|uniref:tetratricopeptide repeat protein n=1 Tax=Streptomyces sp. NBC_00893 TaxID=2975862 RepID=UPI0022511602|nr:tetratricopeptide repeat protein [Streptomyces sp. NBC_00893]MCX4847115.1 tetratricopeptide repeat protein [Streptomyces sp. NBC_00893]